MGAALANLWQSTGLYGFLGAGSFGWGNAVMILVGFLLFREPITWNKLVGIVICLIGLVFINLK